MMIVRSPFRKTWLLFSVLLLLQTGFWWNTLLKKPNIEIVPPVPSSLMVKAIAFGDNQFFFRVLGFQLQNFGDSFGRYTPLKEYDYPKLGQWFHLLDTLDNRSRFIPTMAAYYYSRSQHSEDTRPIITYLTDYAKQDLAHNWWWQVQAVYLAQHRLKDLDLAVRLALPLVQAKNVPIWVNQLAAFAYEANGEFSDALTIMEQIQKNRNDISASELQFMRYFAEERIKSLPHSH
jgi:hypothetical protein